MEMSYRSLIEVAEKNKTAIGHFNISNLEGLWGIFNAARDLSVQVIIGVSEGEREFIGINQVRALVSSLKEEFSYPIFLNADHTYSFEEVKKVVDAGYDSVIFDGSKLSLEENIKITKQCVLYAREKNPNILIEGELGYIGTSSKLLDSIPEDVVTAGEALVSPVMAKQYVAETGVDLLAPAVGNIHGMLKNADNPNLDIERIKKIREAAGVPLVLHGGSGTTDRDFVEAIEAGISIVHINTEIRLVFRDALRKNLQENPEEIAPYRIMKPSLLAIEKKVKERLALFSKKWLLFG